MGFFKNLSMDLKAQSIAANFLKVREEYFLCALRNVEQVLGMKVAPHKKLLGGTADLSMKGFQLWALIMFMKTHQYLAEPNLTIFGGLVVMNGWNSDQETVANIMKEFHEKSMDPTGQIVKLSIAVADYLFDDSKNPAVWNVIGRTLATFSMQTELSIAREFRDKAMMKVIEEQIEIVNSVEESVWNNT